MPTPSAIIPSFYGPACAATGILNRPFSQVTIQDNTYFTSCRDRFPDPSPTYDLFSCPEAILDGLNCSGMREAFSDAVDSSKKSLNLLISPNPSSDYILIENINVGDQVNIYDLLGNLILINKSGSNSIRIYVTNIAPGIYIIKVNDKNPQKFIKSNSNQ